MLLALEVGFLVIFGLVKHIFNILVFVALAIFSNQHLVANELFSLTEKSYSSVGDINNAGGDLATLLAKYKNVRKYLDDGQIKAYLNATDANKFTDLLRKGHSDVLKHMDEMDVDDFGEMIRGYIDNPNAFKNSLADLDKFSGKYGWLTYWKVTPDIKKSFKTLREDLKGKDLLPTGDATEIELATLHAFTVKGDFLNIPLRYNKSYLGAYADKGIKHVKSALDKLRKVSSRKYVGDVFSGKTFSKADFEKTFVGGKGKEVAFDGFVSSSVKEPVAEGFIVLSKQWVSSAEYNSPGNSDSNLSLKIRI